MIKDGKIQIAQANGKDLFLIPSMANRHGVIAGATGTGKTVTMKVLAEAFSDMGVPVFMADVKGDLSGMCVPGENTENMQARIERFGLTDFEYKGYPTRFWDIFGENGHPVRVTISSMGPVLLSRLLGLTEVQQGVLNIVFKVADDQGLLLLDLKDLRAMVNYVGENREEYTMEYGNIASSSIGAIQRALLQMEDEGGEFLFGEPEIDVRDLLRTDLTGRGYVNILSAVSLMGKPLVYSTFLLYMLSALYEKLPEVGDLPKPRMVFFFDEAHLLFNDASKALVQKIVQIVKLIRSKGVGVYFISQSPSDIPDEVLAQLSNRIQHALRAYTPSEQKAIRACAQAFRVNPEFNTVDVLQELGVGEALVSLLDEEGIPEIVERAKILPPQSLMGPAPESTVQTTIVTDEFDLKYRETIDRESAYEVINQARLKLQQMLEEEAQRLEEERAAQKEAEEAAKQAEKEAKEAERQALKEQAAAEKEAERAAREAEKQAEREQAAAQKAAEKEALAAQKAAEKEALAAQKAAEKEALAAQKAAEKKAAQKYKTAERAATNAANSVARSVTTNLVNSVAGGKVSSTGTIAKRAANTALSSVARSGVSSLIRGLFGTLRN